MTSFSSARQQLKKNTSTWHCKYFIKNKKTNHRHVHDSSYVYIHLWPTNGLHTHGSTMSFTDKKFANDLLYGIIKVYWILFSNYRCWMCYINLIYLSKTRVIYYKAWKTTIANLLPCYPMLDHLGRLLGAFGDYDQFNQLRFRTGNFRA